MPTRTTFSLMPDGTSLIMYLVFAPFAIIFIYGLCLRLRSLGISRLIADGPGGITGAVRRLALHALGQRRVAKKPRGWPHLGIFYGFITLLIGTTIVAIDWDVLRPFGVRILEGRRYLLFESIMDLMGAIFVLGLIAALVWRLIRLRDAGLDQRRIQMQFLWLIVGLLYMGITGFLLEGLRLAIQPVSWADWSFIGTRVAHAANWLELGDGVRLVYVLLWWSHALVAFALIAFLPYSSFLHSVGATLNVMVHPGLPRTELPTPFDLREVMETGDFDVKVGAKSLMDLDERQRLALIACTNCGRCDDDCPAVAMGTELSPRGLVQKLRWKLLAGDVDSDLLAEGDLSSGELWACTTCGACVESCPVLIRPVDYIVPFRRELVTQQKLDKRQTELLGNLGRSFNPYGLPPSNRNDLAEDLASKRLKSKV